jgi:preprotein translocase subunit SecG
MLLFLNVIYVLIAIAMIALILMQRGAGAQAGSGFGSGASGTVFGSRGASNFLSKSTKWLAVAFFAISMFMAWNAGHNKSSGAATTAQKGLMSEVPAAPASGNAVPAAPSAAPAIPVAPASNAAPATAEPAPQAAPQQQPAPAKPASGG